MFVSTQMQEAVEELHTEIGFNDSSDLSILQSSSDEIGKAIAEGVDEYLKNN